MARFDKAPLGGTFRAPLLVAVTNTALMNIVTSVSIDANGKVVVGAGNTGVVGIVIFEHAFAVGDIVDVMKRGEVAEFDSPDDATPRVAGTNYYAIAASGLITATAGANIPIGHTVEKSRLVVDLQRVV